MYISKLRNHASFGVTPGMGYISICDECSIAAESHGAALPSCITFSL